MIVDSFFGGNETGGGGGEGEFGDAGSGGDGGAIAAKNATVHRCIFMDNLCGPADYGNGFSFGGDGGAIRVTSTLIMSNCLSVNNSTGHGVGDSGSAAAGRGGAVSAKNGTISHCTFVGNRIGQDEVVPGGAIDQVFTGNVDLRNCLLWGHAAPVFGGSVTGSFSLIEDLSGPDENGNITGDPQFVDTGGGDFRLAAGSIAVNAGDPLFELQAGVSDLDGRPRLQCARTDMGAYEAGAGLGDSDCNLLVNVFDFADFLTCVEGPGGALPDQNCTVFDADLDLDVDQADFRAIQLVFGGDGD